ncbi:hypothetical protein [Methylomonas sp. 11b]|uniref:hypothetical protein n=1 Tax=Methylomonas sp. 11b TaxID=1168169 RepID=UPI00047BEB01|nr:hypothetical protein [Methylomonas sp. 11b]
MANPDIKMLNKKVEIAEVRLALLKNKITDADLNNEDDVIECRVLLRDVITPLNIALTDLK